MTAVETTKNKRNAEAPLSEGPILTCNTAAAVLLKCTKASLTGGVALLTVPLNYTGQNTAHIQENQVREDMAPVVLPACARVSAYWEQRYSGHLLKHPQNKVFTEALGPTGGEVLVRTQGQQCWLQALAILQREPVPAGVAVVVLRPPAGATGGVTGLTVPALPVREETLTAVFHASSTCTRTP